MTKTGKELILEDNRVVVLIINACIGILSEAAAVINSCWHTQCCCWEGFTGKGNGKLSCATGVANHAFSRSASSGALAFPMAQAGNERGRCSLSKTPAPD